MGQKRRRYLLSSRFGYIPFKALKALSFFNLKSYLLEIVSHWWATSGLIKIRTKYRAVKNWPRISNGGSTGRPPIHVNKIAFVTIVQNKIWFIG